MIWFLISLISVAAISFFCSICEATFLNAQAVRLESLKREGRRHADLAIHLKKNLSRTVAGILVLNTIANTGGGALTGGLFDRAFGEQWLWLFSIAFTALILFGSEILPKVIGVTFSNRLALALSPVLHGMILGLRPVVYLAELLRRAIQRNQPREAVVSLTDLSSIARMAKDEELIGDRQERIIVNTSRLKHLHARDIMVDRNEIIFLKLNATPEANYQVAQMALHTRYPVAERDSLDSVVGYVNFKEIMNSIPSPSGLRLREFLRPLLFIPPEMSPDDLMGLLIQRRNHIAAVRDSGGRVLGLITLEDILEEIVGDIEDEFDWVSSDVVDFCPNAWRAGGAATMGKLQTLIPFSLAPGEEKMTVHAWLSAKMGSHLRPRAFHYHGPAKFYIHKIRRGHVVEVVMAAGSDSDQNPLQ